MGLPLALVVNIVPCPAVRVEFTGWVVMAGTVLTVRLADWLVALPATLVATARYW